MVLENIIIDLDQTYIHSLLMRRARWKVKLYNLMYVISEGGLKRQCDIIASTVLLNIQVAFLFGIIDMYNGILLLLLVAKVCLTFAIP